MPRFPFHPERGSEAPARPQVRVIGSLGIVLLPLFVCLVTALVAAEARALQLQSWVATATIQSGNTTLEESPGPPGPPAPVDSTGFLEANGADMPAPSPPIDAGAVAEYDLPGGTLGASAGFVAEANSPDTRIFRAFGGGSAGYFDDLTVTSSTLATGTPVSVRFVFDLAFSAFAASSTLEAAAAADVTSTASGVTGLASADHRYLDLLEFGTFIQNGLFLPPHHAEYTIPTTVGATFSFALRVDADSYGAVRVVNVSGQPTDSTAEGWMGAALSFGGEVVGADAQLVSGLLGGPFPAAAAVSPAQAEAALPFNPFEVPEPGFAVALGVGCLALAISRRR